MVTPAAMSSLNERALHAKEAVEVEARVVVKKLMRQTER
jgi:hypothetical protein